MAFLRDKAVGEVVKIKENGEPVNYIIVHKGLPSDMYDASCDGVWVLREKAHSSQMWAANRENSYAASDIHAWLNGTFLDTVDEEIRLAIKTVKIPYRPGVGSSKTVRSGSSGLSCRVFLLSGYEVGFSQTDSTTYLIDGAKLSYFSDEASRKCMNRNGTGTDIWWLRTPYPIEDYQVRYVDGSGRGGYCSSDNRNGNILARPALILPGELLVDSDDVVTTNTLPTIASDTASGSDAGEVSAPMDFAYTVSDEENDTVTVSEYLDDVQTKTYAATLGAENTFEAVSDPVQFQKILNGQHTIKIVANDGMDNSEPYSLTFNKQVRTAAISLANPLPADDIIKAAVINITGKIPYDATVEVLVTNNALDENPVWENMSREVEQATNHVFANTTAVNGFAFNFRVTVNRGESGEQGFIEKIGGAFE